MAGTRSRTRRSKVSYLRARVRTPIWPPTLPDSQQAIGDRDDDADIAEATDRAEVGPLLTGKRLPRSAGRRRGALEHVSLGAQQLEAVDPLALLAVGGRETRQAVAREGSAGRRVLGRHRYRGNEALGLDRGEDLAPARAAADPDAVALEQLDRVEALHRDRDVVADRLVVEGVAGGRELLPGDRAPVRRRRSLADRRGRRAPGPRGVPRRGRYSCRARAARKGCRPERSAGESPR